MNIRKVVSDLTVINAGVLPIDLTPSNFPDNSIETYRVTGATALIGNLVIDLSGPSIPYKNYKLSIIWEAEVTNGLVGAREVFILGAAIPIGLYDKNFLADCWYNGTSWVIFITTDFEESQIVAEDDIEDGAITTSKLGAKSVTKAKIEDLTQGSILTGDPANRPVELPIGAVDNILHSDGANISWTVISGDLSFAGGVMSIVNNAVRNQHILDGEILLSKLETKLKEEILTFSLSGDVALQRTLYYKLPWDCEVESLDTIVSIALAGGDMVITPRDNGGIAMTGGPLTIGVGTPVGFGAGITPTGNNTFTTGDFLKIEIGGAALTGGMVELSVKLKRT